MFQNIYCSLNNFLSENQKNSKALLFEMLNENQFQTLSKIFFSLKEEESSVCKISKTFVTSQKNLTKWLIFLSNSLHFSSQTLYRTLILLNRIIPEKIFSEDDPTLIAIGCLSLMTKVEEISCNYVKFFTETVLNQPDGKIFKEKDLIQMEMKILKVMKYKILFSTCNDFLEIIIKIFELIFGDDCQNNNNFLKVNLKNVANYFMEKNIINTDYFNEKKQSDYAFYCFNQALIHLNVRYYLGIISQNNDGHIYINYELYHNYFLMKNFQLLLLNNNGNKVGDSNNCINNSNDNTNINMPSMIIDLRTF